MTAIAADFTGDGRPDVISTDNQRRQTLLYPAPDWKPVVIHTNAVVIHSAAMDVDGDGDTDYVGCHYTPGFIFWLERPAEPLKGPWQIHVVDNAEQGGVDGIHGILTGDVDQDGKLDLIGNSAQPKELFQTRWHGFVCRPIRGRPGNGSVTSSGAATLQASAIITVSVT